MRISSFLLFVLIFSLQATNSSSQNARVTVRANNTTLKDVLNMIEKQTNYLFVYNINVDVNQKVSINVVNQPTKQVLDNLSKNTNLYYTQEGSYIIISHKGTENKIKQQYITVSGVVTDKAGIPIIGANVVQKGTTNGTVTDSEGRYSLNVDPTSILLATYIGYNTQEIHVNGESLLNIVLQENLQKLDEIVVVGYGTQKKINLTGSISSIKSTDIIQNRTSNLSNLLSGRLAGIFSRNDNGTPGSGSTILIRGKSTFNNTSPLSIVDGIERDYTQLDPNEIESISILKDASAAAVYGSRAANGVILVTTKRGSIGKPLFSYTGTFGIQTPASYPKMMNPYEYSITKNQAALNMGYDPTNPAHQGNFIPEKDVEAYRSGQKGVNWFDECFRKASPMTQHNFNINGGKEEIKYFFSLGYLKQNGMFDRINFERYNFRSNVDAKIIDGLTAQVSIDGNLQKNSAAGFDTGTLFHQSLRSSPLPDASYTADGLPIYFRGEWHPAEMVKNSGFNKNNNSIFQGTITLTYAPSFIKGLTAKGLISYGKNYILSKNMVTPYDLYIIDEEGNVTDTRTIGNPTSYKESFEDQKNYNLNLSLNYENKFGKHYVSGLLLYEQMEGYGDNFWASRINYLSNSIAQLFAGSETGKDNNGGGFETARQSLVARITYNYANKYYLESSLRYDGSVIFNKNNRWGVFPSVSASWRLSEENFIKNNLKFIDNLKLRASYGILGNDRVTPYQYADYYEYTAGGIFSGEITQGLQKGPIPNTEISWEKASTFDVGLESQLWNSLLSFEFDYFYKRTSDILAKKITSTPGTFGASLPDINYAIVDNQGIDMLIRHESKIQDVFLDISATTSFARNKVIRIDDPANQKEYLKKEGKPINFITGYKSLGLFQSDEEALNWYPQFGSYPKAGDIKYVDINNDNKIDENDQTIISQFSSMPEIIFGLNLGIKWKDIDLTAQFQGAGNMVYVYDGMGKVMFYNGSSANSYQYLMDAWSPENKDAKYPRAWIDSNPNNAKTSDFWMRNANYLKLKNLELGYNIPSKILKRYHINRLRAFLSGTNIFTIKGDIEYDPEASAVSFYPHQRIYSIGIDISF